MSTTGTVKKRSYRAKAIRRWPTGRWIEGDGPWALVAPCPPGITITLWPTRAAVTNQMKALRFCCSQCRGPHYHFIEHLWRKTRIWNASLTLSPRTGAQN